MTEEDKELLLIDLCARLPYHPHIWISKHLTNIELTPDSEVYQYVMCSNCKPYLRPMSSMTEEEKMEVGKLGVCYDGAFHNDIYDVGIYMEEAFTAISWLLERHFDINYLIKKGLALEAPEEMYKTE